MRPPNDPAARSVIPKQINRKRSELFLGEMILAAGLGKIGPCDSCPVVAGQSRGKLIEMCPGDCQLAGFVPNQWFPGVGAQVAAVDLPEYFD